MDSTARAESSCYASTVHIIVLAAGYPWCSMSHIFIVFFFSSSLLSTASQSARVSWPQITDTNAELRWAMAAITWTNNAKMKMSSVNVSELHGFAFHCAVHAAHFHVRRLHTDEKSLLYCASACQLLWYESGLIKHDFVYNIDLIST